MVGWVGDDQAGRELLASLPTPAELATLPGPPGG
jgi:hypothetical protein